MIKVGYEVYGNKKIDFEKSIKKVQKFLSERRPEKYANFLKKLDKLKLLFQIWWLPNIEERIKLFKYLYYAMRILDDICDWDTPKKLFEREKIAIAENFNNCELLSWLISKIIKIAENLWYKNELSEILNYIIWSVKYDLYRTLWENNGVVCKDDLEKNFHEMDIVWTIWWTALIFWIDINKTIVLLKELGEATRVWYNLEDLVSDINNKIINIPREDMEEYWITIEDLNNFAKNWILCNWLQIWLYSQIEKIDKLLDIYKIKIFKTNFKTTYIPEWWWNIRTKLYIWLIKKLTLSWYILETLKTREKILKLL